MDENSSKQRRCRLSGEPLKHVFADLGVSPFSNSYLSEAQLARPELFHPLKVYVAEESLLVQLPAAEQSETIFGDQYLYFSSYSDSWLRHCENYAEMMVERFRFGSEHRVVELASNDGYLLQYFQKRGVQVLGVEPSSTVAKVATEQRNIPTLVRFFGYELAREMVSSGQQADLIVANNVLAHVPDLHDFVNGMKQLLKHDGIITIEFPHLLRLMDSNQFDTIYHEHFSYFSLLTATKALRQHGLAVFDVEELPTHGGSLRVYACHAEAAHRTTDRVRLLEANEAAFGLDRLETYLQFQPRIDAVKRNLLSFLIDAKSRGKRVVGYGAPAKGNTLLNFCGIRTDFIDFTVDRNPHKQGLFLPGTRIPVRAPESIKAARPDYVLVLPWNLRDEIVQSMSFIRAWGGKFVVPIPQLEIIE